MNLSHANLKKLPKHCSKIAINFSCEGNQLTNLIGSPSNVIGCYNCSHNRLTSLIGLSKYISLWLSITYNPALLDVSDIWESSINGSVFFDLISDMAILPLIKFKTKTPINQNSIISDLFSKHMGSEKKNILNFQFDLIESGFDNHARWKP